MFVDELVAMLLVLVSARHARSCKRVLDHAANRFVDVDDRAPSAGDPRELARKATKVRRMVTRGRYDDNVKGRVSKRQCVHVAKHTDRPPGTGRLVVIQEVNVGFEAVATAIAKWFQEWIIVAAANFKNVFASRNVNVFQSLQEIEFRRAVVVEDVVRSRALAILEDETLSTRRITNALTSPAKCASFIIPRSSSSTSCDGDARALTIPATIG